MASAETRAPAAPSGLLAHPLERALDEARELRERGGADVEERVALVLRLAGRGDARGEVLAERLARPSERLRRSASSSSGSEASTASRPPTGSSKIPISFS